MGIKTKISKNDLPLKYQKYELIETKHGVSDSVYLLGDKYVLKIFENIKVDIQNEIELLNLIRELKVIQFVEHLKIDKKPIIVYKYLEGKTLIRPNKQNIIDISKFLRSFHAITAKKNSKNSMIYEKSQLKSVIDKTTNKIIQNYFEAIKIDLKNDGIIHGDLFPDNAKFLNDKLNGVLDFSEACNGDFLFDLAVVAISWCFDINKLNTQKLEALIDNYDKNIDKEQFNEYMKYALLYFSTMRFVDNRDYQELLNRFESLI